MGGNLRRRATKGDDDGFDACDDACNDAFATVSFRPSRPCSSMYPPMYPNWGSSFENVARQVRESIVDHDVSSSADQANL